jgi:hypothetical protein
VPAEPRRSRRDDVIPPFAVHLGFAQAALVNGPGFIVSNPIQAHVP